MSYAAGTLQKLLQQARQHPPPPDDTTDVNLYVGSDPSAPDTPIGVMRAHQLVLSTVSPVFHSWFHPENQDSLTKPSADTSVNENRPQEKADSNTGEADTVNDVPPSSGRRGKHETVNAFLPEFEPEVIAVALDVIYGGPFVETQDWSVAGKCWDFAVRFRIPHLCELARKHSLRMLDTSNALPLLSFALAVRDEPAIDLIADFIAIRKNFLTVIRSVSFLEAEEALLDAIVRPGYGSVTEDGVSSIEKLWFERLVEWLRIPGQDYATTNPSGETDVEGVDPADKTDEGPGPSPSCGATLSSTTYPRMRFVDHIVSLVDFPRMRTEELIICAEDVTACHAAAFPHCLIPLLAERTTKFEEQTATGMTQLHEIREAYKGAIYAKEELMREKSAVDDDLRAALAKVRLTEQELATQQEMSREMERLVAALRRELDSEREKHERERKTRERLEQEMDLFINKKRNEIQGDAQTADRQPAGSPEETPLDGNPFAGASTQRYPHLSSAQVQHDVAAWTGLAASRGERPAYAGAAAGNTSRRPHTAPAPGGASQPAQYNDDEGATRHHGSVPQSHAPLVAGLPELPTLPTLRSASGQQITTQQIQQYLNLIRPRHEEWYRTRAAAARSAPSAGYRREGAQPDPEGSSRPRDAAAPETSEARSNAAHADPAPPQLPEKEHPQAAVTAEPEFQPSAGEPDRPQPNEQSERRSSGSEVSHRSSGTATRRSPRGQRSRSSDGHRGTGVGSARGTDHGSSRSSGASAHPRVSQDGDGTVVSPQSARSRPSTQSRREGDAASEGPSPWQGEAPPAAQEPEHLGEVASPGAEHFQNNGSRHGSSISTNSGRRKVRVRRRVDGSSGGRSSHQSNSPQALLQERVQ